uniref:Uncharacterized protein n=1 Tax=viral metagenome TaxID=1070528 RepID=A0A6M3J5Y7_9ZZZZ
MIHGNRLGGYAIDPSDFSRHAGFDSLFKVPVTIDVGHHEIHDGDSFHVAVVDTVMADTETLIVAFKTPSGAKLSHMVFGWSIKAAGHVDLVEGPTWTTNTGTVIVPRNRLRSGGTSTLTEDKTATPAYTAGGVLLNPTGLAGGTTITLGYGFASKTAGNQGSHDTEWVLKAATAYAIVLTADANSNGGFIELDWYEHTSA